MAKKTEKAAFNPLSAVAIIVVLLAVGAAYYLGKGNMQPGRPGGTGTPINPSGTQQAVEQNRGPQPTPTIVALKQGKESYTVGFGEAVKGPKFTLVEFDPHEPKQGEKQTITVTVAHPIPVTSMTVTLQTDTKTATHNLSLISGTNTNGKWQDTWTVDDTLLRKYLVTVESSDGTNKASFTFALRNQ